MRYFLALVGAVPALFWTTSLAAQNYLTTPAIKNGTVVTIGDDDFRADEIYLNVNKVQCDGNAKIEIAVQMSFVNEQSNYNPPRVEVWRSNDESRKCNEAANRKANTSNNETLCEHIGTLDLSSPGSTFTIKTTAQTLFGSGTTSGADDDVDGGTPSASSSCENDNYQWIYVLGLDNATNTQAPENAIDYSWARFLIDVTPPGAPDLKSVENGEQTLTVNYQAPSNIEQDTRAEGVAYFDVGSKGAKGPDCSSAALDDGEVDPKEGLKSASGNLSSASISPGELGLALNEQVPVAVAFKDGAGNVGELSEVQCVAYIKTSGFWQQCTDEMTGGDCKDQFDTCSAAPWRPVSGLVGAGVLAAFGLVLARRRRRNS